MMLMTKQWPLFVGDCSLVRPVNAVSDMSIKIIDLFANFKGLDHQIQAIDALEEVLGADNLSDDANWVKLWRSAFYPETISNSWDGIELAAIQAGAKFPQVVAAQWALESAWGQHVSGKNNFFGIKGPGTVKTTWEDYGSGAVTIKASFKDYPTIYACILELVTQWYKDYKSYRGVNRAETWQECCYLLKAEGYATDPVYADKLIALIKAND